MIATFFDGLDELYYHTKFGKDRTTRASCRCENMVFVRFTGRMPQNDKLTILNLLSLKISFSPRRGDSLRRPCTDSRQTWHGRRARGSDGCAKFHLNRRRGWACGPKIYKKFPLFGKESPRRGEPFDRFLKFLGLLYAYTILHLYFKFDKIRFTGYGVIAEKPRVRLW